MHANWLTVYGYSEHAGQLNLGIIRPPHRAGDPWHHPKASIMSIIEPPFLPGNSRHRAIEHLKKTSPKRPPATPKNPEPGGVWPPKTPPRDHSHPPRPLKPQCSLRSHYQTTLPLTRSFREMCRQRENMYVYNYYVNEEYAPAV